MRRQSCRRPWSTPWQTQTTVCWSFQPGGHHRPTTPSSISDHTHSHRHTRLTALCPGLPGWGSTRKVKPIRILLKQETVSGSGISWAIRKSAPRSRQITMPAPHHSVFRGRMPFLSPNQQRQSTEGSLSVIQWYMLKCILHLSWNINIPYQPVPVLLRNRSRNWDKQTQRDGWMDRQTESLTMKSWSPTHPWQTHFGPWIISTACCWASSTWYTGARQLCLHTHTHGSPIPQLAGHGVCQPVSAVFDKGQQLC